MGRSTSCDLLAQDRLALRVPLYHRTNLSSYFSPFAVIVEF